MNLLALMIFIIYVSFIRSKNEKKNVLHSICFVVVTFIWLYWVCVYVCVFVREYIFIRKRLKSRAIDTYVIDFNCVYLIEGLLYSSLEIHVSFLRRQSNLNAASFKMQWFEISWHKKYDKCGNKFEMKKHTHTRTHAPINLDYSEYLNVNYYYQISTKRKEEIIIYSETWKRLYILRLFISSNWIELSFLLWVEMNYFHVI